MTYQEYFALREQLAKAEQAYLNAWKACKRTRKKGKRLSAFLSAMAKSMLSAFVLQFTI